MNQSKNIVRVAGFSYLLIIVIGILNGFFIESKLIILDDTAATLSNIVSNELLFRIGIVSVLVMYAMVVILSWALYLILKNVNQSLALLAMFFRLAEATIGVATVIISLIVLSFLNADGYLNLFEMGKLQDLVMVFLNVGVTGLNLVLLFVGLGGTLFCYLFYISRYIPRIIAAWGIFTYLSMLIFSVVSILFPERPDTMEIFLFGLGALFELTIGLWLLIKGAETQHTSNNNVELV